MLEKIESAYLGILRVTVLVSATIAMVVFVVGLVMSGPAVISRIQIIERPVEGGNLRTFIEAQKARSPELSQVTVTGEAPPKVDIPPDFETAVQTLKAYMTMRANLSVDVPQLRKVLRNRMEEVGADRSEAYAVSLRRLADQLVNSTGAPLSGDNIDQLLEWHDSGFRAEVARREADDARRLQGAVVSQVVV